MLHVDMYATCSLIYLACDTLYNQCRSMPYGFFFLFFFFFTEFRYTINVCYTRYSNHKIIADNGTSITLHSMLVCNMLYMYHHSLFPGFSSIYAA